MTAMRIAETTKSILIWRILSVHCIQIINEKAPRILYLRGSSLKKMAASYSPALHCSTIGAGGLNFSVRNGKRWDPAAITTWLALRWMMNEKWWMINTRTHCTTRVWVTISTQELKSGSASINFITPESIALRLIHNSSFIIQTNDCLSLWRKISGN